jgi:hypothetical protein
MYFKVGNQTLINAMKTYKHHGINGLACGCVVAVLIWTGSMLSASAAAARHDIAAATLNVAQPSITDSNTVVVTAINSVNDFRPRAGSNNGDITVQVGSSGSDDPANGVLMSSVAQNGRSNDNGTNTDYGVCMIDYNANGYWIPINSAANAGAGNNPEFNINVAGAWFPHATWLGGVTTNNANGGVMTALKGSPGLVLGTHIVDKGGGKFVVNLTSFGIDSRTDGVLLVSGAKNESANYALSQVNTTNGTWNLFIKDAGETVVDTFERDPIAFVFIPKTNTTVISGRFLGDGTISMYSGAAPQFTVTVGVDGKYTLKMIGYAANQGVLIISAEGGESYNQDNMVSYAAFSNNTAWTIQSRDTPGASLQSPSAAEGVVSFVFIPLATPGVTATPSGNLMTSESGGTATFQVSLDTAPTNDVVIAVTSSNPSEGTVSPEWLTFTTNNWHSPQTVTITGQDDAVIDGTVAYHISLTPVSGDTVYDGITVPDVSVANVDNEAGVTIAPVAGLVTTEAGGTATFTVRLNTQPTADVTIGFSSSAPSEGTVSPASLTFSSSNWDQAQTVTVTGLDDLVDDGDANYTIISAPATSADGGYNLFNAADVSVVNMDDDTAGVLVTPTSGLSVAETGTTANYTVVLQTQPTADVVVNVSSSDATEGTVSPAMLTFTASDWNTPKSVTVTGVDDLLPDGAVAFTITNRFTSSDPVYAAMAPIKVSATNLDNEAAITLSPGDTLYGTGMPAVGVDGRASITEPYSANYNAASLTFSLVTNGVADDRLEIRSTGNGTGQIGVSGGTVTYGGVTIATATGGTGTTPLAITFNSAASLAAAEALLHSVTFRSVSSSPSLASRTVAIALVHGDGGASAIVRKTIRVGLLRQAQFQQGADWGYGVYTRTADISLSQRYPDTVRTNTTLAIDWPDVGGTNASQALLRFDNIFGANLGQIPTNAIIVGAELILNGTDTGHGSPLYRMLMSWDVETSTWNSWSDGVQPNDSEARSVADSQLALFDGSDITEIGSYPVDVTPDVVAWANGEANYGWVMPGWMDRLDGTAISSSRAADLSDRPRLRVLWVPAGTPNGSFRQGVNGYTDAVDTTIRLNAPDANYATLDFAYCDAMVTGSTNNPQQILMRFDNIIGTGAGQIPPGAQVHAAILDLASIRANSQGDGGQIYSLLKPWDDTTCTWNTWTNGISANGIEAATTPTATAGFAALTPLVQGGFHFFEVTPDVAAWVSGARTNYGWAILPWSGGGDGWGVGLAESATANERPQLRVYFTANSESRITWLTRTPTSVVIDMTGAAGTAYSVQRADAATGPYAPIGTATADSSGAATYTDNAPLPTAAFYRLSYP